MSTTRTMLDIRAQLDDAIAQARMDAEESSKILPNSYGDGYDRGFLDALVYVRKIINSTETHAS